MRVMEMERDKVKRSFRMPRKGDRLEVKAVALGVEEREGSRGRFNERSNYFFSAGHRVFVVNKNWCEVENKSGKNRGKSECKHSLLTNCEGVATWMVRTWDTYLSGWFCPSGICMVEWEFSCLWRCKYVSTTALQCHPLWNGFLMVNKQHNQTNWAGKVNMNSLHSYRRSLAANLCCSGKFISLN